MSINISFSDFSEYPVDVVALLLFQKSIINEHY